jgi:hypothetical protein
LLSLVFFLNLFLFLCTGGEQLLKMIVDVATIFNDIPSSCHPENENAKGASWAERMENMGSEVYGEILQPLFTFFKR